MSLVISTAFHSSYIQSRAFVVMGVLGTSDVDDDLLYQILVAFKNALASLADTEPNTVIGILRCITRVVPGTPRNGRYLAQIAWLAIALMEYGDVALFAEAAALLQASLETLEKQEIFSEQQLIPFLFEARVPLEEVMLQIDDYIGLSFEKNFSFTLAAIIFRGMRASQTSTNNASASLLKTLLRLSAQSAYTERGTPQQDRAIHSESLGYFLALLPTAPTVSNMHTLLKEAGVGPFWFEAVKSLDVEDVEDGVPRVSSQLLGLNDTSVALLVATFLGAMLNSATAVSEREILFTLLADMSSQYPETITQMYVYQCSMTSDNAYLSLYYRYESIQERVIDAFSNVTNPAILSAVGIIFRASIMEIPWQNISKSRLNGSASTIGTIDPTVQGAGRIQLALLEEMQMRGMLSPHQFLPRTAGMRLLHCMVDLVGRIIE
jgi:neurofibromin 1